LNGISKQPIRILLVDDHRSFLEGLEMVINSQKPKMEVVGMASNSVEAMKAAVQLSPDVILLDMDLGGTLSLDFLPNLLGMSDAKVLFLTGLRDADIHDQAILKGARGILLKDEPAKVIIRAIEKVVDGEIWASKASLARIFTRMSSSGAQSEPEKEKIKSLTNREREIIAALVSFEDSTNDDMAGRLFISSSTLKNHLTTIYSKLGLSNRVQLLKYALKHDLGKSR
jgi:two-component system, NarL family, nitrate/nitrite response regulator NarL